MSLWNSSLTVVEAKWQISHVFHWFCFRTCVISLRCSNKRSHFQTSSAHSAAFEAFGRHVRLVPPAACCAGIEIYVASQRSGWFVLFFGVWRMLFWGGLTIFIIFFVGDVFLLMLFISLVVWLMVIWCFMIVMLDKYKLHFHGQWSMFC